MFWCCFCVVSSDVLVSYRYISKDFACTASSKWWRFLVQHLHVSIMYRPEELSSQKFCQVCRMEATLLWASFPWESKEHRQDQIQMSGMFDNHRECWFLLCLAFRVELILRMNIRSDHRRWKKIMRFIENFRAWKENDFTAERNVTLQGKQSLDYNMLSCVDYKIAGYEFWWRVCPSSELSIEVCYIFDANDRSYEKVTIIHRSSFMQVLVQNATLPIIQISVSWSGFHF